MYGVRGPQRGGRRPDPPAEGAIWSADAMRPLSSRRLLAGGKWLSAAEPKVAEGLKSRQRLPVFGAICRELAANDVVGMADGETLHIDVAHPGVLEALDAIRREHEIEVEGAVFQLHEVL